LANTDCQQWYKDAKKSLVIVDTAMCAGLENGGKDSCQVNIVASYLFLLGMMVTRVNLTSSLVKRE
jgi:hypothetical protein